mmetsp:Transcript_18956/g.29244  ORF Transcript_18956/g.29244 Transcript_18956/m.29244 type:complete len:152 (-) Transcript_18956:171-626(-)
MFIRNRPVYMMSRANQPDVSILSGRFVVLQYQFWIVGEEANIRNQTSSTSRSHAWQEILSFCTGVRRQLHLQLLGTTQLMRIDGLRRKILSTDYSDTCTDDVVAIENDPSCIELEFPDDLRRSNATNLALKYQDNLSFSQQEGYTPECMFV